MDYFFPQSNSNPVYMPARMCFSGLAQTHKALSSTPSHHSSSLALSSCRPRGKTQGPLNSRPEHKRSWRCNIVFVGVLFDEDNETGFGPRGHMGCRPGSGDFSHHTSSSNSPVNCKGTDSCIESTPIRPTIQHYSGTSLF